MKPMSHMLPVLLISYIALTLACSSGMTSTPAPSDPKPAIESAVRSFMAERQPTMQIKAISMQKIGEVYLVSTVFEGRENVNSFKTVAQEFRNNDGSAMWRIEPFNSKWRSLLRIEE